MVHVLQDSSVALPLLEGHNKALPIPQDLGPAGVPAGMMIGSMGIAPLTEP